MSNLSFLKVTLVPESTTGPGTMDLDILLAVSSILAVRKKIGFEYEIVLIPKFHMHLEAYYFGKTKLKEIKAKIKDESILY
jgi:hypothetical protein